jgi:hypothetical protein
VLSADDCLISTALYWLLEDSHAVPPIGTFSSSPVPSSYRQIWGSPPGTLTAYNVVTLGGDKPYRAASICLLVSSASRGDVPSIKSGDTVSLVLLIDRFLVECLVMRVLELWLDCQLCSFLDLTRKAYTVQTLVLSWDLPISDKLNLGLMRYRL